jgi:hypothetical protein
MQVKTLASMFQINFIGTTVVSEVEILNHFKIALLSSLSG